MYKLLILLFLFTSSFVIAQNAAPCEFYKLSSEEKLAWLNELSEQIKEQQWSAIADQYFKLQVCTDHSIENYAADLPLLVINGVPYLARPNQPEYNQKFRSIVNLEGIEEIKIITKEPEGLIWCAPFKGLILITTDKKTARQLRKLKMPRNY